MKKTEQLWTATVALAALIGFCFVAEPTPSFAQISFGKMRDASEKGKKPNAPIVDEDEDADAFDVDPNEKADAKADKDAPKNEEADAPRSSRTIGRRSSVAGGNASRTTPRPTTARTAAPVASAEEPKTAPVASAPQSEKSQAPEDGPHRRLL
jgi:hypothetical protein